MPACCTIAQHMHAYDAATCSSFSQKGLITNHQLNYLIFDPKAQKEFPKIDHIIRF